MGVEDRNFLSISFSGTPLHESSKKLSKKSFEHRHQIDEWKPLHVCIYLYLGLLLFWPFVVSGSITDHSPTSFYVVPTWKFIMLGCCTIKSYVSATINWPCLLYVCLPCWLANKNRQQIKTLKIHVGTPLVRCKVKWRTYWKKLQKTAFNIHRNWINWQYCTNKGVNDWGPPCKFYDRKL